MKTKKAYTNVNIHVQPSKIEHPLSQEEVKRRLTAFFELLMEIDQQNNVSKEYIDAEQAK